MNLREHTFIACLLASYQHSNCCLHSVTFTLSVYFRTRDFNDYTDFTTIHSLLCARVYMIFLIVDMMLTQFVYVSSCMFINQHTAGRPSAGAGSSKAATAAAAKEEFDFQSANARFEKMHLSDATAATGADASSSASASAVPSYDLPTDSTASLPVITKKYDKSKSFFDELGSSDSTSTREADRRQQRRVDVDTFGSEAAHFRAHNAHRYGHGHAHPHTGGRGGRGRGGRGRGRGRGGQSQAAQQ